MGNSPPSNSPDPIPNSIDPHPLAPDTEKHASVGDGDGEDAADATVASAERENIQEKNQSVNNNNNDNKLNYQSNLNGNLNGNCNYNYNGEPSILYPVRPGAELCSFYMRTGSCKFGSLCKFNHPFMRKFRQGGKVRGKEDSSDTASENVKKKDDSVEKGRIDCKGGKVRGKEDSSDTASENVKKKDDSVEKEGRVDCKGGKVRGKEDSSDTASENVKKKDDSVEKGRVDCKYFDRPGGCKYGKSCKFNHSKKLSPTLKLNFMGLPIRPGEKECPYYMRNSSCKFGASCRFNHPDPTSVGGLDALPTTYSNGGPMSTSNASQSTLKSWSPALSNENPAYLPLTCPPTQGVPCQPEWSAYQAPVYPPGSMHMLPTYTMNGQPSERNMYSHQNDTPIMVDEFPERPGQPECSFFLKTGNCKYKSACIFHHPKNASEKPSAWSLSEMGLPLRPGENICSFYSRYGICKYGPVCKYDHPLNFAPSAVNLTPGMSNSIINNHAMAAGS